MTWLARTPLAVVKAHAAMLPRLDAEAALAAVERVAVGTGSLRRDEARSALRRWQRQAEGDRRAVARPASPASLAAMGIRVIEAPARA